MVADKWYLDETKVELKTFGFEENQNYTIFYEEIKSNFEKFNKNLNAEQFFISFYSNIIKYTQKYIQLHHPFCVIVAIRFGEELLVYFKRKQNEVLFEDPSKVKDITERKMKGLRYLAGYVVTASHKKTTTQKTA